MRFLSTIYLILVICGTSQATENRLEFNRDIRPILSDKCYHCHGPDSATREAELRFDIESSAKAERDGSFVIKPSEPDQSELVARITTLDPDLVMPPLDAERPLTDEERQKLVDWIKQGADWQGHWAFEAPKAQQLPTVDQKSWPHNGIDYFILNRLEAEGLQPSPAASRTTWLRRVTLDLTGLPPTLSELDSFLADQTEDAYERVVDRLLASPRYGEHMAVGWLDAARYADTDGYQNDGPRTMYRWRDWVIDAYNSNMPFDLFTIEQLAGDLLPNPTLQQKIATGFNRNHRYNSEAGLIQEEFLLENAVDRVDTTSTVWMGLTMGCGRCHDHKYDPFSQQDYYQLISFFDNVSESGRAVKYGNSEPWVIAPTTEQQASLDQHEEQIAKLDIEQERLSTQCADDLKKIERLLLNSGQLPNLQKDFPVVSHELKHHFRFENQQSKGIAVEEGNPEFIDGFSGKSAKVTGKDVLALGKVGRVQGQERNSVAFWLKPEDVKNGVILSRQKHKATRPGLSVIMRDGHLQYYIIERWRSGAGVVESVVKLEPNEWVHIVLINDGSQSTRGMKIWINGKRVETKTLYNTNSNTGGTDNDSILRFGGGVHGKKFSGQIDELRFYERTLLDDEIRFIAEPAAIVEIVTTAADQRTDSMNKKLVAWMLEFSGEAMEAIEQENDDDTNDFSQFSKLVEITKQLQNLRLQRIKLIDSFPTSMVMEEWPIKKQTHVRVRGTYNQLAEPVSSDVPAAFPPMSEDLPANRLGLAKWLVNGKHPLTARVAVNRYWQRYFGTGIVKTPEDFGLQGELPSHPRLLDWLALEFVKSGWDVKSMQKLIVLSSTYRQSSRLTEDLLEIDPVNRLLARGPRLRLSARILRDQALFVAGLLTPDIGGPSVSPYQPAKLWDEMSNMTYTQSKGKDLYRRGLYTIWKRTVAPPSLAILDAADRENCVVRPKRTNTPLQALTLLNETTFVEAARHLAARIIRESDGDVIEHAFRMVTLRNPTEQERNQLTVAREEYFKHFEANPKQAKQLVATGESPVPEDLDTVQLAANTMLCNVLLNLDEVLTKE